MIVAENVHKSFDGVRALQGVSLRAADGKVTALLGPNGAGKTTTLRVLYGVLAPDEGRAMVDDVDVAKQTLQAQKRLGVLPHARGLYPRLTPREHVQYAGRLHGMSEERIEQRLQELAVLLEMKELLDRRTEGFSEGQRLKVAIARSLVHDPRNVVLDEPTNGLDVTATRALRRVVERLREEGRCVVFSSHVMQEVSLLCDHIVVIARGQVAAEGTAEELLASTGKTLLEDAFVAAVERVGGKNT